MACAFQRRLDVGHSLVGIDVGQRRFLGNQHGIGQQALGKRLQPGLAGDHRLGAALGFVGQIQVFQAHLAVGVEQVALQFRGQLALLGHALEYRAAPLLQLAQVAQALFEVAHLGIVEAAGGLLAIARNEGHRGALVEQVDGGLDLMGMDGEFLGDALGDAFGHGVLDVRRFWLYGVASWQMYSR